MASSQPLLIKFQRPNTNKVDDDETLHPTRSNSSHALFWLILSILLPLIFNASILYKFRSLARFHALPKPSHFPPLWLLLSSSTAISTTMTVAVCLFYDAGGFDVKSVGSFTKSSETVIMAYIYRIVFGDIWVPFMVVVGWSWVALFDCVVHLGSLILCYVEFRKVSVKCKLASDLVLPCMAWASFMVFFIWELGYLKNPDVLDNCFDFFRLGFVVLFRTGDRNMYRSLFRIVYEYINFDSLKF